MISSVLIRILFAILIVGLPERARGYEGECQPDFSAYARNVAHITVEHDGKSASGTAAWLNPDMLITLDTTFKNVFQDSEWKNVTIRSAHSPYEENVSLFEKQLRDKDAARVKGRKVDTVETVGDSVIVIRLDRSIANAEPVSLQQSRPIRFGDPMFSVLYVEGGYWPQLRYAAGHFFKPDGQVYREDGEYDPRLLWAEMVTRPNPRKSRKVAESGSAGSPVFNCDGALVGMVSGGLTQKLSILGIGPLPTAWGVPNIIGVRISLMLSVLLERIK